MALATPANAIRQVGPAGYSSTLADLASNGITGGWAVATGSPAHVPWINRNGTAEVLATGMDADVFKVNSAGQAIGAVFGGGTPSGFFFDGTTVHDIGVDYYPQFLSVTGVVGGGSPNGAWLYKNGSLVSLVPNTAFFSQILSMNAQGDAAGIYLDIDGLHPFVYTGTTLTELQPLVGNSNGEAVSINNSGAVTGSHYSACGCMNTGFVVMGGVVTELPFPPASDYVAPFLINGSGMVSGNADFETGVNGAFFQHAFLYSGGNLVDLTPGEEEDFETDVMNEAGNVAGSSGSRVFLSRNGLVKYFPNPGRVLQMNSAGDAVGGDFDPANSFVIRDGVFYFLTDLNKPGSGFDQLSFAGFINDLGQIGGTGLISGQNQAFVLEPVPEPGAMGLSLLGGAGLLVWRRVRARIPRGA